MIYAISVFASFAMPATPRRLSIAISWLFQRQDASFLFDYRHHADSGFVPLRHFRRYFPLHTLLITAISFPFSLLSFRHYRFLSIFTHLSLRCQFDFHVFSVNGTVAMMIRFRLSFSVFRHAAECFIHRWRRSLRLRAADR